MSFSNLKSAEKCISLTYWMNKFSEQFQKLLTNQKYYIPCFWWFLGVWFLCSDVSEHIFTERLVHTTYGNGTKWRKSEIKKIKICFHYKKNFQKNIFRSWY